MRHEALERVAHEAVLIPTLQDIERYCEMREDYLERCSKLPTMSRYQVALMVCAYGFDMPLKELWAHDRKSTDLVEIRQKMMAFSRIVSLGTPKLNTWKGIGQAFKRRHSTVIHATQKFGAQIAAALEVSK